MATREQAAQPGSRDAARNRTLEIARQWEAGETGCGVLIVGLKREIRGIQAGELLHVTALDAGAPRDIPAWCRLTGHTLIAADHPTYVLRKRDD
ncbi:MAG TPA: sulfurtransferase TusA family protein [Polyangiales bacterium]|nr:sulfurtransferase TusA family protein [Polyangiales bacterium]